jgi:hypothetical protein
MNNTERIKCLIDRGTWHPMDEDMTAQDVFKISDENLYKNHFFIKKNGFDYCYSNGYKIIKWDSYCFWNYGFPIYRRYYEFYSG